MTILFVLELDILLVDSRKTIPQEPSNQDDDCLLLWGKKKARF